jgi:hypothetical protein
MKFLPLTCLIATSPIFGENFRIFSKKSFKSDIEASFIFSLSLENKTFYDETIQKHYKKVLTLIITQHTLVCSLSSDVKSDNLQLEANTSAPVVPMSSELDSTYNQIKLNY